MICFTSSRHSEAESHQIITGQFRGVPFVNRHHRQMDPTNERFMSCIGSTSRADFGDKEHLLDASAPEKDDIKIKAAVAEA
ncbi:hypothetical protein ZHAS_00017645 [Anopheles sinensis]|uniref:Uncharacterized protein n=1 Tax=Anopheles sinensis TaxID=74873 RepID=A0A084WHD4_ANOSI|nr:hypothetical protein ZHAS_00017645 [Anopheles sinensis]